MMNFQDYVDTVKSRIKEYLPEEYAGAEVNVHETRKLNETYTALSVRKEDQVIAPSINLDAFFQNYDGSLAQLNHDMERIAELAQTQPGNLNMDVLTDYNEAKSHLFIRVSSLEENKDLVDKVPHMIKEDLLITYHIVAELGDDGMASSMVNNQMMENFHVTEQQLHNDALESSKNILPASISTMFDTIKPMIMKEMMKSGMTREEAEMAANQMSNEAENPMMIVTNDRTVSGAGVIFYPNVMETISERLGSDFFILPSSVHETIVLPDNGAYTFEDLREMVGDVNSTQVLPEDKLTNEVYHFDSKEHVFEKAETFADRQKAKEKAADKSADKNLDVNNEMEGEDERQVEAWKAVLAALVNEALGVED